MTQQHLDMCITKISVMLKKERRQPPNEFEVYCQDICSGYKTACVNYVPLQSKRKDVGRLEEFPV